MLRKVILTPGTQNEIDIQVEKIVRGLGHPEPPLDLDAVFRLQQLDPQYYRTSEDGVVRETISRVKVGAKLFFERPTRIWDAIKTANLKALWIPEQKRILVDDDLHTMKKRWSFAHEIGHSILDWHRDFTFGDDQLTLVEGYHIDLEAEANYAAGILLFLQDHFHEHVKGVQHTLKSLIKVADGFRQFVDIDPLSNCRDSRCPRVCNYRQPSSSEELAREDAALHYLRAVRYVVPKFR